MADGKKKQAIDATRTDMFLVDPSRLVLVTNKRHPLYDRRINDQLDEAMIANIVAQGVHTPIDVRKERVSAECPPALEGLGSVAGEEVLVVVKGRHRVRWARAANELLMAEFLKSGADAADFAGLRVPTCVKKLADDAVLGICLSENSVRVEESVSSKAEKISRYIGMGHTEAEAAVAAGVTVQSVRSWMKILELDPKVRKAVDEGRLTASAAVKLAELPRDEQLEALEAASSSAAAVGKKRPTAKDIGRATGDDASRAPSKRKLRKVCAWLTEQGIGEQFCHVAAWIMGELDDDQVGSRVSALGKALVAIAVNDDKPPTKK